MNHTSIFMSAAVMVFGATTCAFGKTQNESPQIKTFADCVTHIPVLNISNKPTSLIFVYSESANQITFRAKDGSHMWVTFDRASDGVDIVAPHGTKNDIYEYITPAAMNADSDSLSTPNRHEISILGAIETCQSKMTR